MALQNEKFYIDAPVSFAAKLKSKAKPKNRRRVGTLLDSEAINKI